MTEKPGRVRRRLHGGVAVLPSLFTTATILLGFNALISGYHGVFGRAALLIFAAAVIDTLDGRLARLTGTESEFGKNYDSLADLFNFGAVPAVLSYFWGLESFGRVGWLIPVFYLVCTATRLARFNVQTRVVDSRFFVGLPAPAAAGAVCSVLFFAPDKDSRAWLSALLAAVLVLIGSLMVSTFRYPSFKRFDLRRRHSYRVLPIAAALLLLIAYHPPAFFLALAVVYTTSGPAAWLAGRLRNRSDPVKEPR